MGKYRQRQNLVSICRLSICRGGVNVGRAYVACLVLGEQMSDEHMSLHRSRQTNEGHIERVSMILVYKRLALLFV